MVQQVYSELIIGIISGSIGTLLVTFLAIVFRPLNKNINHAYKWFQFKRNNPNLNVVISLGCNLNCTKLNMFKKSIHDALSESYILSNDNSSIKTKKKFDKFDAEIEIIPTPNPELYIEHFSIIIRPENIKLKELKENLLEIQKYLYRDLITDLNKNLKFEPIKNKEAIDVKFDKKPTMLDCVKDLNIKSLDSKYNGVTIKIYPEKMNISGLIEIPTIDRIEKLLKDNLIN